MAMNLIERLADDIRDGERRIRQAARAEAGALEDRLMAGWNSDLDGGLWWVEWQGLRFRIEMTEKGWKAICSFSDGMDCAAGVEEAAGYLGTFALLEQARWACRRHARRALEGRYRRK